MPENANLFALRKLFSWLFFSKLFTNSFSTKHSFNILNITATSSIMSDCPLAFSLDSKQKFSICFAVSYHFGRLLPLSQPSKFNEVSFKRLTTPMTRSQATGIFQTSSKTRSECRICREAAESSSWSASKHSLKIDSITLFSWWHFRRHYLAQAQRHIAMWSNAIIGKTCSEDWFVRSSAAFVLAEAPTRWHHWLAQCAKILPRLRAHCIGTILAQVHRWSGVAEFGAERRVVSDSATDKTSAIEFGFHFVE